MSAHIRRYASSDLDRCRELWVELTQHHRDIYGDPSIGGVDPGLFFDKHLARVGPERIWVVEVNGEVVGLVGLIVDDRDGDERVAVVEPLVVASSHQNKGLGRALLTRAVEEANKLNVRYLSVRPVARNLEAISLYYDFGFRVLGEIEMFMELRPSASDKWKSGLELFGYAFRY